MERKKEEEKSKSGKCTDSDTVNHQYEVDP